MVNSLACFLCLVLTFSPLYFSPQILHSSQTKKEKKQTLKSATNARRSLSRHQTPYTSAFAFWGLNFLFNKMKGVRVLFLMVSCEPVNMPCPVLWLWDTQREIKQVQAPGPQKQLF